MRTCSKRWSIGGTFVASIVRVGAACGPANYSFSDVLGMGLMDHLDEIDVIATRAGREYGIECILNRMAEDLNGMSLYMKRYKDYVTYPKPSGYRSVHMTLRHKECGINLEVQIRSKDMHLEAEYGRASHSNYKALALPASINRAT